MNTETIKALKIEELELVKKIKKANENGEFGTYKNLVQALERILYLQERFQNTLKTEWCKYKKVKEGKEINVISIWEQQGEITKNKRVFEIKEEIIQKEFFDITNYVKDSDKRCYGIKGTYFNDDNCEMFLKIDKGLWDKYLNHKIKHDDKIIFEDKIYSISKIDKGIAIPDMISIFLK
ncbi:hypothetical protein [Clostridium perfringens]|uniref:hypothetical protein n=1 Tax=Clostridium perfringens TaxID=1502 RepID=UPI002341B241|nr:hypothetical protein [Clostridium perfringens]MDC4245530.1 hypothetical protein [Clostridium perfringens]